MAELGTCEDAAEKERDWIRTFETGDRTVGQDCYAAIIADIGVESWLYDQDTLCASLAAEHA